jgi:hypothetical protein
MLMGEGGKITCTPFQMWYRPRVGQYQKGFLHNAKIFPEGFMVSLGFQAMDNPVDLLHLP